MGPGLTAPLSRLLFAFAALERQLEGGGRIAALLAEPDAAGDGRSLTPDGFDVRFRDVRFAYAPGNDVLRGVSLDCPAGEVTALVGPSGAGKSTMLALVSRLYEAGAGSVMIGGVDVADISVKDIQALVATVFQDPFLFEGTIAENLRIARPAAEDDVLRHDFIMARGGYDVLLDVDGGGLSGGERQRLAIARALLKGSRVLVLDEATAQVDLENEAEIQAAIAELTRGRTVVAIAHRLWTVVQADEIWVMDDGVIIERGRHDDLLVRGGPYAQLWRAQAKARGWRLSGGGL